MTATGGSRTATPARAAAAARALAGLSRIGGWAWAAAAVAAAFVALSAWWLSVDRSVPYNDAAQHLFFAFSFREALNEGELIRALGYGQFYPPAAYLLGALATVVGGVSIATPILAQNILFVPLLAVACFQLGRMTTSPPSPAAGLLAVVFALSAPLIVEQFHVFMLDIPQTALAAAAVWLVIASGRFARVGVAASAGVALGLGIATKELAPVYVVGVVACALAREGGWRNWRGLLAFATAAAVVGLPWYVRQVVLGHGHLLVEAAGGGRDVPPAAHPPLVSAANAAWYLWATLDALLFAPLFAFAAVGVGTAVVRVRRTRAADDPTPELLVGLGTAWLLLTLMPHHDLRYAMGFIVFLAVLGTAWIVRLGPAPRSLAAALLVAAIALAQLGATFGVGGITTRHLPGNRRALDGEGVPPRGRVIVYASNDYMVSGPQSQPDVLALLRVLRREGVATVGWQDEVEAWDRYFEEIGLIDFAYVARLGVIPEQSRSSALEAGQAMLIRARAIGGAGAPCLRFADGSGVWVHLGVTGAMPRTACPAGFVS